MKAENGRIALGDFRPLDRSEKSGKRDIKDTGNAGQRFDAWTGPSVLKV
jgi:hypothetical protein